MPINIHVTYIFKIPAPRQINKEEVHKTDAINQRNEWKRLQYPMNIIDT